MKTYGQVAYEAACLARGWPIRWDDIDIRDKAGWEAAAVAVLEQNKQDNLQYTNA